MTGELLKLSEASRACGIPARIIKVLADSELLPQAQRGNAGHLYIPADAVPTWSQSIGLLTQARDRSLADAAALLARLDRELEAVRNDIAEAREYPHQLIGVDFRVLGTRQHSGPIAGQPTVTGILEQFDAIRLDVLHYDTALREAIAASPDTDG